MQDGPVDFLGQLFQVGDTIVYPNRRSSFLWMNKARVIAIKQTDRGGHALKVKRSDGIVKSLTCLDRVIVITGELRLAPASG